MGVPKLYKEISQLYPLIESTEIKNATKIYFDMNGIIHWAKGRIATERVYVPKHKESYERAILLSMQARINQIMKIVNPSQEVGFFVDGPAPRAKMKQQLQRRVKGPKEFNMKLSEYDKIDKSMRRQHTSLEAMGMTRPFNPYDGNAITPGTEFMSKVNDYLFDIAKEYKHLNVVISTSNEPGEGEHKMFNYIKRNEKFIDNSDPDTMPKLVIVGLDADLILLSLVTQLKHIFLMRESIKTESKSHDTSFIYADIGLYRGFLLTTIRNIILDTEIETGYRESDGTQIIDDYIFMCSLLGNDFVPHSPALSIEDKGIQRLIELYVSVFNETKQHLVNVTNRNDPDKIKTTVNVLPVRKLINRLAIEEDSAMTRVYDKRCKLERYMPRIRKPNPTVIDDANHRIYFKPATREIISKELDMKMFYDPPKLGEEKKTNDIGDKQWRTTYYNEVLRMKRSVTNIEDICKNYLEGIAWVFDYYYTESHSWGWFYRYIASPPLRDLAQFLNKHYSEPESVYPIEDKETARMKPYQPFQQLMMVLPKSSSHLLPKKLGKYMTGEVGDLGKYYSDDIELNYFFHVCLWQTEPLIDLIDEKKVETVVNTTKLTEAEQKRNSFTKMVIIKPHK